jgi:formyltetrahydrofolate synthetase
VRRVTWRRVVDVNDRSLRDITIALGGTANGYPRQDGFDIVVASKSWRSSASPPASRTSRNASARS